MKIRSGFVSNSSSSSFICGVCKTVETGYDGEYNIETTMCDYGHEWCAKHDLKSSILSTEQKVKIISSDEYFVKNLKDEDVEFLKSDNKEEIDGIFEQYEEDNVDEISEYLCPVCTLSSISDTFVLKYLLKRSGKKLSNIKKEIRNKFNTLNDLKKGLK